MSFIPDYMCKNLKTFVIIFLSIITQSVFAGYGDPVNGSPLRTEREVLLMTNAVRMAPQEFRDLYIQSEAILLEANYPAVGPIWHNEYLHTTAHNHTEDMASTCGLQHNSCDGTIWSTRIKALYTSSSTIAENVATGISTGLGTIVQWLRDDDAQGTPAADKSSGDGHRKNIMNASYHEIGCGYAYSSSRSYNHFWTQDFGGSGGSGYKIPAGSHFIVSGSTTKINFGANYYDKSAAAPLKAAVIIDNTEYEMTLLSGISSAGTYNYSMSNDKKSHCYFFEFTDGSGTKIRYPETLNLSTLSDSACTVTDIKQNKVNSYVSRNSLSFTKGTYYRINGTKVSSNTYRNSDLIKNASGILLYSTSQEAISPHRVFISR